MAITVDWPSGVIFVPKTDMAQIQTVPFEIRQLDLIQFWRDLRALQDGVQGRTFPRILDSDPPTTVAGTPLARTLILRLEYYSVEFDDVSGTDAYRASLSGANSNVADAAILNLVQVRPDNSAGLVDGSEINEGVIDIQSEIASTRADIAALENLTQQEIRDAMQLLATDNTLSVDDRLSAADKILKFVQANVG